MVRPHQVRWERPLGDGVGERGDRGLLLLRERRILQKAQMKKMKRRDQIHETGDRTREISGPATARSAGGEGAATNLLPSGREVVALGDRPRLVQRERRRRRRRRRHGLVLPRGSRQAEGSGAK